jgi:hypothetical protein
MAEIYAFKLPEKLPDEQEESSAPTAASVTSGEAKP